MTDISLLFGDMGIPLTPSYESAYSWADGPLVGVPVVGVPGCGVCGAGAGGKLLRRLERHALKGTAPVPPVGDVAGEILLPAPVLPTVLMSNTFNFEIEPFVS